MKHPRQQTDPESNEGVVTQSHDQGCGHHDEHPAHETAAVAQGLIEAHRDYWTDNNPLKLTGAMLEMAMLTPSFGVSK